MNRPIGLLSGDGLPVRVALSVIALVAAVALAVHLTSSGGGLLDPSHISSAEAQNLSRASDPPVHQAASAACFRSDPAVMEVRSHGDDVLVRFAGQAGFMRIQYLESARAAIRDSYAHGSPDNFYANTNWFDTPPHLTTPDLDALGNCLPTPGQPPS